jgi:hypothetical protein
LLDLGEEYSWQVIPHKGSGESIIPPGLRLPEPRFRVLGEKKINELAELEKNTKSHLVLGLRYFEYGLLEDAESEFKALYTKNPDSKVAEQLLNKINSIKKKK